MINRKTVRHKESPSKYVTRNRMVQLRLDNDLQGERLRILRFKTGNAYYKVSHLRVWIVPRTCQGWRPALDERGPRNGSSTTASRSRTVTRQDVHDAHSVVEFSAELTCREFRRSQAFTPVLYDAAWDHHCDAHVERYVHLPKCLVCQS